MLTADDVAERLGITRQRVYDLARMEQLHPKRVGRVLFFDEAEVEAFCEKRASGDMQAWSNRVAAEESARLGIELWGVPRTAKELGVTRERVHSLIKEGRLKAHREQRTGILLVEADSARDYLHKKREGFKWPRKDLHRPGRPRAAVGSVAQPTSVLEALASARVALGRAIEEMEKFPSVLGKRAVNAARRLEEGVRELEAKVQERVEARASPGASAQPLGEPAEQADPVAFK